MTDMDKYMMLSNLGYVPYESMWCTKCGNDLYQAKFILVPPVITEETPLPVKIEERLELTCLCCGYVRTSVVDNDV